MPGKDHCRVSQRKYQRHTKIGLKAETRQSSDDLLKNTRLFKKPSDGAQMDNNV